MTGEGGRAEESRPAPVALGWRGIASRKTGMAIVASGRTGTHAESGRNRSRFGV